MKERNMINHIYIYIYTYSGDIQENGKRNKLEKECGQKLNADAHELRVELGKQRVINIPLNYTPLYITFTTLFHLPHLETTNFNILQHLEKEIKKKYSSPNLLYRSLFTFIANEARAPVADKRES